MTSGAGPAPARVRIGGRSTVGQVATTWSVSDGSRGRRWRASSTSPGGDLSYALETATDGTFVKIEAATGDALLTLHREPDGSLHGHVVRPTGLDHLSLGILPTPLVVVEGEVLAAAALVAGLRGGLATERAGQALHLRFVRVTRMLDVEVVDGSIERMAGDRFRVTASGLAALEVVVDGRGLPVVPGTPEWPLERRTPAATVPRSREAAAVDGLWTGARESPVPL